MAKEDANKKEVFDMPLYVIVGLFIVFIALFYLWQSSSSPVPAQINQSSGNMTAFQNSLIDSNNTSILMNVTGLNSSYARYVYTCGAGLAGSWGNLGKNVSNMHIYVLDGDTCTSSSPIVPGQNISNNTISRTTSDCINDALSNDVSFYIMYGPTYTLFTDKTAYIFVNDNFTNGCSFQAAGTVPSTISENNNISTNGTQ